MLTANDRCDSCGAEAKVRAFFINGELLFCGHHARDNHAQLLLKAISVDDPNYELELYEMKLNKEHHV